MKAKSLAAAVSVARKAKKMAEGGSVKNEARPMPEATHDDAAEVSRNSGKKAPSQDSWTDSPTVAQAQKPSITRLSRPKMVGSSAFSVRDREDVDKDLMRMDSEAPASPKEEPRKRYDEEDAAKEGPSVPALGMKKMAHGGKVEIVHEDGGSAGAPTSRIDTGFGKIIVREAEGGMIEDMNDQDSSEVDEDHHASVAAAIMAKKERMKSILSSGSMDEDEAVRFYEGGQVEGSDESTADIESNGAEQPNAYYGRNREILKENYDSDMDGMSQPKDSNEEGDSREDEESDKKDMVSAIRRKMMAKR